MEKSRVSRGEAMSFGFKRAGPAARQLSPLSPSLPSVTSGAVTKETIQPLVIPPIPNHGVKAAKEKREKSANRFGFRPMSGPMSNKVGDLQTDKEALTSVRHRSPAPQPKESVEVPQVTKVRLQCSQLPRPQAPVLRQGPQDKWAKTQANRQAAAALHTQPHSPQVGNNKFGFRGGTKQQEPNKLEIEQLDRSPSANKYRQAALQKRPSDIWLGQAKSTSLQEVSAARASRLAAMSASLGPHHASLMTDSIRSLESNEDKLHRDQESSEKSEGRDGLEDCPGEELWGHGEAMALEEDVAGCLAEPSDSPEAAPPLRSVLLKIEDPTFAALAMDKVGLLEDERSPDSAPGSPLSCSPPSVEPLPPPPLLLKDSPSSPLSPGHGSNSYSSDARDRDFLIDDEIADQPGLVFNSTPEPHRRHPSAPPTPLAIAALSGQVSKVLSELSGTGRERAGSTSLGTLSPCESLAPDDLMVDFDCSEHSNELNDVDDSLLRSELELQSSQVMREWNSILSSHPGLSNGVERPGRSGMGIRPVTKSASRLGSLTSVHDSPKSHSSFSSPHKATRTGAGSPGDDNMSDDSGIRVDRGTYQHMFQEVINIKTMLLRLKRVLQESETLDPFEKTTKNGLYLTLASSEAGEDSPHQLADVRRQVVLMQHQMEEKERRIQQLEAALARATDARRTPATTPTPIPTMANAATQTDRVRPLSTGPILLQTSSEDSPHNLVSCSSEAGAEAKQGRGRGRTNSRSRSLAPPSPHPVPSRHSRQQRVS